MYYRIEETTSEDRRAITFALDTVIEDLERAYRLMVSLYEDYAYEMPNRSQWEDVRDRSNVIIDIVHNAIFSYKLTVGDASAVRDYVEAAPHGGRAGGQRREGNGGAPGWCSRRGTGQDDRGQGQDRHDEGR